MASGGRRGSFRKEESSPLFNPSRLEFMEELQKHLSWYLNADEILLHTWRFTDSLSKGAEAKAQDELIAILHDKCPKKFSQWIDRVVVKERQ